MTVGEAWALGGLVLFGLLAWHVWKHSTLTVRRYKTPYQFHISMMGEGMMQFKENMLKAIALTQDPQAREILKSTLIAVNAEEDRMLSALVARRAELEKEAGEKVRANT